MALQTNKPGPKPHKKATNQMTESDVEALEKRKAELKGRVSDVKAAAVNTRHYPELKGNDNVKKIDVIIGKFITALIDENRGGGLLEVDYTNKEMVTRRKDQMSVIKEHINLIKQLKDVREILAAEKDSTERTNLETPENISLMDDAKELLAKKGIRLVG